MRRSQLNANKNYIFEKLTSFTITFIYSLSIILDRFGSAVYDSLKNAINMKRITNSIAVQYLSMYKILIKYGLALTFHV